MSMSKTIQRDYGIVLIRVISTFMIIITHLIREIPEISFAAQFTNLFIYTFLFISGWLFGRKEITNSYQWIKKRLIRILIPSYLFLIILFGYELYEGNFNLFIFFTYLFNLQGIIGGTQGASHYWFMTAIMFCYIITPILSKFKYKLLNKNKRKQILFWVLVILLWIVISMFFPVVIGEFLFYLIFYSFAYYLSNIIETMKNINYLLSFIIFIISIGVRLLGKIFLDDSVFYNVVIFGLTQGTLGILAFTFLYELKNKISSSKLRLLLDHFDKISYEMFITHYSFIVGPFFIWGLMQNVFIDSLLIFIATYMSAQILNVISNKVIERIN